MHNMNLWTENLFSTLTHHSCWTSAGNRHELHKEKPYMIIPCSGNTIEIPMFVLRQYSDIIGHNSPERLVVELQSANRMSKYNSFSNIIKSIMEEDYDRAALVRFLGTDGDNYPVYYGTKSAVFDEHFKPLMMCTWEIEDREVIIMNTPKMKKYFKRPILRIIPDFFTSKYDNVGRFICKKVMPLLLYTKISPPQWLPFLRVDESQSFKPCLIVDDIPFEFSKTCAPSVSVTNEELRELALKNINDMAWT